MDPDIEQATHELLLRLAGRLPDKTLWRFRDWLAEGAMATLARTIPRSLLKHSIDLDQPEYRLLVAGLIPHGADWHQVSSTLGVDDGGGNRYTFTKSAPDRVNSVDSVSVVVHATLRGRPDVGEVRASWRHNGTPGDREPKRVLLVSAVSGMPRLTGELQRVLRVLGDEEPSIEVLPPRFELPEYHRAALANSELVCVGAVDAGHRLVAA
ncbi:hypothetical protein ACPZ19_31990 [Amycolatopsis lurida]|uniref:hypothetical protein n=1 Tax=Amycolatopsis sp. YIM 10 TaxID=2653857 RepID=UPI001290147F|nr:hypothetical protein [Amycolatopsis sp. YIM 10]QFU85662.1 hypothetical protein YIM_02180 [Amycolatopsis sp. YIM 10]